MKKEVRHLYHSFAAGYFLGVLVALTAIYEGFHLNESQFAKFFFPDKFDIPQLNKIVFQIYYVLFGGFVMGSLVVSLCLVSLIVAHYLKLDPVKTKRAIYVAAFLAFSLLVAYSGFLASVRDHEDLKAIVISGLLAGVQLLLMVVFIFFISRVSERLKDGKRHLLGSFLGCLFFILARSCGIISSGMYSDYSERAVEYQIYPLVLMTLCFLGFILWASVRAYLNRAERGMRSFDSRFQRRSLLAALHFLFGFALLVWLLSGFIIGSLPVEDRIHLSRRASARSNTPRADGFNVIILLVDMLRRDHLGCYGYERMTSPFIDEMAAEGIKFNNAVSQCSWTLPSVATVFSGYYPTMHGVKRERDGMPTSLTTIAEMFRERGYSTAAFITNPYLKKVYNLHQGFDWYDDNLLKRTFFHLAVENTPYLRIIPQIVYETKRLLGLPVEKPDEREFVTWWSKKLNASSVNMRALKWVKKNRKAPFFLYVHYIDVHGPYDNLRTYVGRGKPKKNMLSLRGETRSDEDKQKELKELYDGAIQYVDEQVKDLVDELKDLGVYGNSLIVFTSDHGRELLEHGALGHGATLYHEQLRIPLIIFPTDATPERGEIDASIGLIDLFPILDSWLDLSSSGKGQPVSLMNSTLDSYFAQLETRKFLFSETDLRASIRSVVLENKWKYIEDTSKGTRELYDLQEDPTEQENLLSEHPILAASLREHLDAHFAELESHAFEAKKVKLDEWTEHSLKAIGYLE